MEAIIKIASVLSNMQDAAITTRATQVRVRPHIFYKQRRLILHLTCYLRRQTTRQDRPRRTTRKMLDTGSLDAVQQPVFQPILVSNCFLKKTRTLTWLSSAPWLKPVAAAAFRSLCAAARRMSRSSTSYGRYPTKMAIGRGTCMKTWSK